MTHCSRSDTGLILLTNFEKAAISMRPLRLRLLLGIPIALVGGFLLANLFAEDIARPIRGIAMIAAWWLWLLFMIQHAFHPENLASIDQLMFPRAVRVMLVFFMTVIVLGFVAPIVYPVFVLLLS